MPRGRKTALTIRLTPFERQTLLILQRTPTIAPALARRARIILLRSAGMTITDIATTVGIRRHVVYKWIHRFLAEGLDGLHARPGPLHRPGELPESVRGQPNNLDVG
jgi:hypothetical protein